jgi:F-type H+-transporting ATPase subunit b
MRRLRPGRTFWLAVGLFTLLLAGGSGLMAQSHQGGPPAARAAAEHPAGNPAGSHQPAEGGHEGGGAMAQVARLVNFAILVGTLVYFLRSPLATYLRDRMAQVRSDLVKASETRAAAAARLAEIARQVEGLPADLDALRQRGAEEAQAEDTRLREAAYADRARLLDHARREIEAGLKVAERELVRHAAALAVAVAVERVKRTITDADQLRLADRYLAQVASQHGQQG